MLVDRFFDYKAQSPPWRFTHNFAGNVALGRLLGFKILFLENAADLKQEQQIFLNFFKLFNLRELLVNVALLAQRCQKYRLLESFFLG